MPRLLSDHLDSTLQVLFGQLNMNDTEFPVNEVAVDLWSNAIAME